MAYGKVLNVLKIVMKDEKLQKNEKLVSEVLTAVSYALPQPLTKERIKRLSRKWDMSKKSVLYVIQEDLKTIKKAAKTLKKRHKEVKGKSPYFREPIMRTLETVAWLEGDIERFKTKTK